MLESSTPLISKVDLLNRKFYLEHSYQDLPEGEIKKDTERTLKEQAQADDRFWFSNCNSISGLNKYKQKYPQGRHVNEIALRRESIQKQEEQRTKATEQTWHGIKTVLKYGGLTICAIILLWAVYTALTTEYKITWASIAPLAYAAKRLFDW